MQHSKLESRWLKITQIRVLFHEGPNAAEGYVDTMDYDKTRCVILQQTPVATHPHTISVPHFPYPLLSHI
jgi:hypothetical protein